MRFVAGGADPKTIQTRLGHSTPEMTLNVYSHRVQDSDRRLAEAFEVLLGDDRRLG
jgi:integrase